MTPEEIYQRMLKALKPFENHQITQDTKTQVQSAISRILVDALPLDSIGEWIRINVVWVDKTKEIGVQFFSHPDPPPTVAKFIADLRDHGFQIPSDPERFE